MDTDQFIEVLKKAYENQSELNTIGLDFKVVEMIFEKELTNQFTDNSKDTKNQIEKIVTDFTQK